MLFLLPTRGKSTLETGLGSKYSIILLLPMLFRILLLLFTEKRGARVLDGW